MKTNRKKCNLNELAGIMPIIDREEQQATVGSAHIFDNHGNYLGFVGTSQEIRIQGQSQFTGYQNEASLQYTSQGIGVLSQSAKMNMVRQIAQNIGVTSHIGFATLDGAYAVNSNGAIYYNINSRSFQTGNYQDFALALSHEDYHGRGYYGDPNYMNDAKAEERAALMDTFRNPNFLNASDQFRSSCYASYLMNDGNPNDLQFCIIDKKPILCLLSNAYQA